MSILRTKITNSLFCFWKCFKFDAYIQLNRHLYNEYWLFQDLIWNIVYQATSMVTSLCEKQGTNWKDSAQIYEDVSRTEEITIIYSKTGISETVDSWRTKELVQI